MNGISIIIPSRNRKKYIANLLNDLAEQTYVPSQIIVIDQSDEPYHLTSCDYYHILSLGPSKARNYGIAKAKGDIIIFLDDDIHIENNFIEELIKPILENKSDVVCGAICDENGKYPRNSIGDWSNRGNSWLKSLTSNPDHPLQQYCIAFPAGCVAIKRSILDKIGYFDDFFDPNGAGEDREIAIRLLKHGYLTYYNGKARIYHLKATSGGRRELGNSGALLDANIGYIIRKHFGQTEFNSYKLQITLLYITNLLKSILTLSDVRTKIYSYIVLVKKLSEIKKINI